MESTTRGEAPYDPSTAQGSVMEGVQERERDLRGEGDLCGDTHIVTGFGVDHLREPKLTRVSSSEGQELSFWCQHQRVMHSWRPSQVRQREERKDWPPATEMTPRPSSVSMETSLVWESRELIPSCGSVSQESDREREEGGGGEGRTCP
jgi:hypothetical protein